MIKILFIGSFLSKVSGTKGIYEKFEESHLSEKYSIKLVSKRSNIFFRYLDIVINSTFLNYNKIVIGTFSGLAFRITEVATLIAYLRRREIILTLRGGALPDFYKNNQKRIRKAFLRASYIHTPSLYLQNFFTIQNFNIHYLPNPVNLEHFPYKRDQLKPYSLLWVRAFTEIYNPNLAVNTLMEVRKQYPNATLTMVGPDKGLLNKTRILINQLCLNEAISIIGPVKNDQLFQYYQTHEVFINTTSYESFGVAVVEAAACGIPVVSTKVGEIPYLWKHEENMLIIDSFDANLFAREVIKLLDSKELASRISINARAKAETFDWEIIKEKWNNLLLK